MNIVEIFDHALKIGEVCQIYTGTKNYWRTRQTLDIVIFEHFTGSTADQPKPTHFIEIVAFDPSLNVEAPHIYMKSERLCTKFQEKAKKSSNANLLLQEELIPGQKYAQQMYTKYIMNRLAIKSSVEHLDATCPVVAPNAVEDMSSSSVAEKKAFEIYLLSMADEGDENAPIFTSERPDGLATLPSLKHHRRTGSVLNPAEFKRKLSFIRRSSLMIEIDLGQADKLSDLSMSALSLFDQLHKNILQRRSGGGLSHSKAKQRWLKAINIVIIRIELAKTRAMLAAHDARKGLFPPSHMGSPSLTTRKTSLAAGGTPFQDPAHGVHLPPIGAGSHSPSAPDGKHLEGSKSHATIKPTSPEKDRRPSIENSHSTTALPHLPAVHGAKKEGGKKATA